MAVVAGGAVLQGPWSTPCYAQAAGRSKRGPCARRVRRPWGRPPGSLVPALFFLILGAALHFGAHNPAAALGAWICCVAAVGLALMIRLLLGRWL